MTVAQALDRSIAIRRATTTWDEYNSPIETWATIFRCRASRRDVSDGERFAAGLTGAFLVSRFIVRSTVQTRSILPSDILLHDGKDWNITAIKERDEGRRRFLEITAKVAVDG